MNVLLITSALNRRTPELAGQFKKSGFEPLTKWLGIDDWPEFNGDLAGVVVLEDNRGGGLETLVDVRKRTRSSGVPIIVVPDAFGPEVTAKYNAAGATQICSPDDTDERIVAEVQCGIDIDTDETTNTRLTLLHPFLAATVEAMQIMANINVKAEQVFRKSDYTMQGDISGLIYLLGATERMLAVSFPMETARNMAIQILAGVIKEPSDEVISDCVGEMVNIVAGQVKGRFVHTEYEFDISTPAIISGPSHEIRHRPDLPCYVMTFGGETGRFAMQLCVRGREAEAKGDE